MTSRGRLLFPIFAFLGALALGAGMTASVWVAETQRARSAFERTADVAVDRIVTRIEQHVVLLQSTRGLFAAFRGAVDRDTFSRFLTGVDLVNDLSGIQGIGFARMVPTQDTSRVTSDITTQYGLAATVRPETDQTWRTPIVLIEPPSDRNLAALGFDMYAEATRRAAMDRAISSGRAQMSGPVELVQEITQDKQTGFLIYTAITGPANVPALGFVYAPFRGGDLVRAALSNGPPLPLSIVVHDSGAPDRPIYRDTINPSPDALTIQRNAALVGRQWVFTIHEVDPTSPMRRHLGSLLVGMITILFAGAVAFAVASRQQEAEKAKALAAAAKREAEYRELLLQEMKHRIKNHIARIQSIARQSARGATDVKAFTDTFDSRLQAMAAVQEILAGTAVAQADLRAILRKELQQCLDTEEVTHLMDGPSVTLDERQSHAFAMVAHELVTNAMKYGGLSTQGTGLRVTWSLQPRPDGKPPMVAIDWQETFPDVDQPASGGTGFGSRLIDASLKGELQGSLSRNFSAQGLQITVRFPMNPAHVPAAAKPKPSRRRKT